MIETTARIRWTDSRDSAGDPAFSGGVGTLHGLFKIWPPEDPGDEWLLTTCLPGMVDKQVYGFPLDLKAEAERWLAEHVASLGAVFPEQYAGHSENEGGTAVEIQPQGSPVPPHPEEAP